MADVFQNPNQATKWQPRIKTYIDGQGRTLQESEILSTDTSDFGQSDTVSRKGSLEYDNNGGSSPLSPNASMDDEYLHPMNTTVNTEQHYNFYDERGNVSIQTYQTTASSVELNQSDFGNGFGSHGYAEVKTVHKIVNKSKKETKAKKMMGDSSDVGDRNLGTRKLVQEEKRHRIIIVMTVLCCIGTYIGCIIVLNGLMSDQHNEELKLRLPCVDLTRFYPFASWYERTDQITNETFERAGIRRVRQKADGVISCEVHIDSLTEHMMREEYNAVEGKVTLEAREMGPTLSFSAYSLSVLADKIGNPHQVVTYDKGLIIVHEGDYFIYFGIELDYKQQACRNLNPKVKTFIGHLYIQRGPYKARRVLMASMHTCTDSRDKQKTNVYSGGIFHLVPDDKLFIQVSAPIIVGRSEANFLGAFRLPA